MTRRFYVIEACPSNDQSNFWNNEMGWGSLPNATVFTSIEAMSLRLPVGGHWVSLPQAPKKVRK